MKLSRQALRDTLVEVGPMTASELARFFPGDSLNNVSAQIYHMRRTKPPQLHISGWTREDGIGKAYLRAVYAAGNKRDARKPQLISNAESSRRWKAKRTIPKVANSIWNWGTT